MVATTSGTTTFTMDVDEIIEQALQPLGGEYSTGYDMGVARTVLNLLLIELQNKNVPLNKIETLDIPLVDGTGAYTLDAGVSDILELTILDPSLTEPLAIPIERWGLRDYHQIPNKEIENRPTAWTTDRQEDSVIVNFWPVPDKTYTAKALVTKRVEDITASYQRLDLSYRYLPLLVAWLSYKLSVNKSGIPSEKVIMLKQNFSEIMLDAFDEDRERVDFIVKPGGISGR